ncbi:bud neck involved protein [Elasticomyces elasticus]|nr:bud neck involved protein [Elasticomyces elasticus]
MSYTPVVQPAKLAPARYRRPPQKREISSNASVTAFEASVTVPSDCDTGSLDHLYMPLTPVLRTESVENTARTKNIDSELAKKRRRRMLITSNCQHQASLQAVAEDERPASEHGTSTTSATAKSRPALLHLCSPSDNGGSRLNYSYQIPLQVAKDDKKVLRPHGDNTTSVNQENVFFRVCSSFEISQQSLDPPLLLEDNFNGQRSSVMNAEADTSVGQAAVANSSPLRKSASSITQFNALSSNDNNKEMKPCLRHAFTLESAMELQHRLGEHSHAPQAVQQGRKQQEQKAYEGQKLGNEHQKILRRQQAASIRAGTLSRHAGFSGYLESPSIPPITSSTPAIRQKINRGAQQSALEMKELVKLKTIHGVPAANALVQVGTRMPVQCSAARMSMAAAMIDRHKVNLHSKMLETAGGNTRFLKLEGDPINAASAITGANAKGIADGLDTVSSHNTVVGNKHHADITATVRKGILRCSNRAVLLSTSPMIKLGRVDLTPAAHVDETIVFGPLGEPEGGRQIRSLSSNSIIFTNQSKETEKSLLNVRRGGKRNVSFDPRLRIYNVWSATEYDRRAGLVPWNCATSTLAHQMKKGD